SPKPERFFQLLFSNGPSLPPCGSPSRPTPLSLVRTRSGSTGSRPTAGFRETRAVFSAFVQQRSVFASLWISVPTDGVEPGKNAIRQHWVTADRGFQRNPSGVFSFCSATVRLCLLVDLRPDRRR